MAILSIAKNRLIRNAFKHALTPLLETRTINRIFKTDVVISRPHIELPSVSIYLDEGEEIEADTMDTLDNFVIRTTVVLKFMIESTNSEEGDDEVDEIAIQAINLLNEDLRLGGLLKYDLEIEDFLYEHDPNQLYTALVFRSNIEFYDK